MKKNATIDATSGEFDVADADLGTLLFVSPFLSMSWAQNKTGPIETTPPLPGTLQKTFQWDCTCPGGRACSFICQGRGGASASHVIKLNRYLGTIPFDSNQNTPAVFYDFSTIEIPHASGFIISVGLSTLACQVNGMTLDYSGPPK
jgi:hypothetical protein